MKLPQACPAVLDRAVLCYGSSLYPVKPNETLPLPAVFDFGNPIECARLVMAIMSNASGGHPLRNCRLILAPDQLGASIVCSGAHVHYSVADRPKLTATEALARFAAQRWYMLGDVVTDQYGDGYTRARWRDSHGPRMPL